MEQVVARIELELDGRLGGLVVEVYRLVDIAEAVEMTLPEVNSGSSTVHDATVPSFIPAFSARKRAFSSPTEMYSSPFASKSARV